MLITRHNFKYGNTLIFLLPLLIVACRSVTEAVTAEFETVETVPDQLKFHLSQDGFYKVSQDDLLKAGLQIDELSIDNLALSQGGYNIPFLVFEDYLIFYAELNGDRYVKSLPIILKTGNPGTAIEEKEVSGIREPRLSSISQTIRLEENKKYTAIARKSNADDVWFWKDLPQQKTFDTDIELQNLVEEAATIRINAWGVTYSREIENDHDFDLIINDEKLETIRWGGQGFFTSKTTITPGILNNGLNSITLDNRPEGATFLDITQINWLELEYQAVPMAVNDAIKFPSNDGLVQIDGFSDKPIAFDITDILSPKRLVGWDYSNQAARIPTEKDKIVAIIGPDGFLSPESMEPVRLSSWSDPQQADLLIITTDNFIPALDPLVTARQEQGLEVAVISINEIYDEFGDGAATPLAIQTFVANALENWQDPKPRYLLLVGDATTDYLANNNKLPKNIIPSILVPVQYSGETVSDSRLVDTNDDMIPEIAVGRWTAQTSAEVKNLVERTLDYERSAVSTRTLFAADGSEARFGNIAQTVAESSNFPLDQVKILEGPPISDLAAEWIQGVWVTTYIGHGSLNRWGKDDILNLNSAENLRSEISPVILQMTCLTGLFSHPEETSLSEAMLIHPKGPVLIVAATSLTLSAHQEPFAIELLTQLQNNEVVRIGDAFQKAKLSLDVEKSNGLREVSDTFVLLGDPSAPIVRPSS